MGVGVGENEDEDEDASLDGGEDKDMGDVGVPVADPGGSAIDGVVSGCTNSFVFVGGVTVLLVGCGEVGRGGVVIAATLVPPRLYEVVAVYQRTPNE